ncbi:MAG TPA: HEPN domain-containing protein [Thermoproteales archaeon]|nr:HEPN domain-containing protein [Thermoproteales archaeon]
MEIDPREEVFYRLRLAEEHLETAFKRFTIEDWAGVVEASQLAAENAAKSIIAHFHIPSWTHDSSEELREVINQLPPNSREPVLKLVKIVKELAPEHGRTSHGLPTQRITPAQLYDKNSAEKVLQKAHEAVNISKKILKQLGYKLR